MGRRKIKIAFSSVLCDAGEATRAMEIAEGIRDYCPQEYEVEVTFYLQVASLKKRL